MHCPVNNTFLTSNKFIYAQYIIKKITVGNKKDKVSNKKS